MVGMLENYQELRNLQVDLKMLRSKEQSEQWALNNEAHMDVWSFLTFSLVQIVCEPTAI